MKHMFKTILAFILGVAGGLLAGMLLAPHKGTITRAKLKTRMEEKKEHGLERAHVYRQRAKEARRQARERFGHSTI